MKALPAEIRTVAA